MSAVSITSVISMICYLLAGVLVLRQFFGQAQDNKNTKVAQGSLMLGIVIHLSILILSIQQIDGEKLSLTFVLATLAWLVSASMYMLNKLIKNIVFLPIVCFLSALFVFLHLIFPATTGIDSSMNSGVIAHITLSILAFGILGISMLYALQLSYINYQLKHKRKTMLHSDLPPLLLVEDILYKLMLLGTLILAASLISGFVFVPNMFAEGYAHKTTLSTVALLTFISALIFHHKKGLKARHAIIVNVVGIAFLSLAYFGSRIVQEVIIG